MAKEGISFEDFAASVDVVECNRRLLHEVGRAKRGTGTTYEEWAEMTGISARRLRYLLNETAKPELYLEEVKELALRTGTALDTLFGLPIKSDSDIDSNFEALQACLDRYFSRDS